MDSNPFAVWDEPAPGSAKASIAPAKSQCTESQDDSKHIARLSIEYQEDDPGWGAASASISTSRANSPEKTRKQSPTAAAAIVSATTEPETTIEPGAPALTAEKDMNLGLAEEPATEEPMTALTIEQHAEPEEATHVELVTKADDDKVDDDKVDGEEEEEEEAFEDSRQEQKTEQPEGSLEAESEEFAQKATLKSPPKEEEVQEDDEFDDLAPPHEENMQEDDGFDDFGEPAEGVEGGAGNDDFGDFDDFETGDAQNDVGLGDDGFGDDGFDEPAERAPVAIPAQLIPVPAPVPIRTWQPLEVTSRSTRHDLAESVQALLPHSSAAERELTNVALRQVEGPSQVLVSEGSRQLWADLSSFPSVKPIDWVRSKTRRDYIISMGIPVNLDEIHSCFASGSRGSKQLPPLQLKYDSSANRLSSSHDSNGSVPQRSPSLKVSGTCSGSSSAAQRSASTSNSPRNGNSSPALGSSTNRERIAERRREELGLGPAPQVDLGRAEELVKKTEDQLTLLSLPALKTLLRELNTLTTSTSSLLTHHLTLRESYQADSEMYNSMIKELVTGAANRFSGGSGGSNSVAGGRGDSRRSTTMGMSASSTGKARVSSMPAASTAMSGSRSISPSLRGGAASSVSPRR
ncbi:uncharacterized protein UBRO_02075 [Ustilago bromivora]|uniref:Uncharacterized protein n=1 Tax=Ustilago bromivora TaxID=307758 RepID=A0A1K0H0I7_9BASI|nr:uncharacterized protein UBRO_02075 [Ustilago bromivora]SYW80100.1 uncharacterized protein UBRO2_03368 [Ustilago bromivora]